MGRHKFLVWGVALLLVASGLVAVLLWSQSDGPVSRARWERLQVGMTLEEVEAVLGGPPSDYRTGEVELDLRGIEDGNPDSWSPTVDPLGEWLVEHTWSGDDGLFWVGFDKQNRLKTLTFYPGRHLTVIDKLRAWLGF